jgi:prepilin-type N-terminal cleavage/methylation domain-containing protein
MGQVSMNAQPRSRASGASRGFTLIELLVVMVILAIIVAFAVPRLTSVQRSEGRLAVDQVEDLMRMWAYRNSVMTQQVGIWRQETGVIVLVIRDIDPSDPDAGPVWQNDRLSSEVTLPSSAEILTVVIDGEPQDPRQWFVQSNADGTRPRLEIEMKVPAGVSQLVLAPYSSGVGRLDQAGVDSNGGGIRQPIDLDSEGEERMPW